MKRLFTIEKLIALFLITYGIVILFGDVYHFYVIIPRMNERNYSLSPSKIFYNYHFDLIISILAIFAGIQIFRQKKIGYVAGWIFSFAIWVTNFIYLYQNEDVDKSLFLWYLIISFLLIVVWIFFSIKLTKEKFFESRTTFALPFSIVILLITDHITFHSDYEKEKQTRTEIHKLDSTIKSDEARMSHEKVDTGENITHTLDNSTNELDGTIQKLKLEYVDWSCACANWATAEDIRNAHEKDSSLADKCVFIEPTDSALILPDTIGYGGDQIVFRGQFYKDKGYPKGYKIYEEPVEKARVFRYTQYKIIRSYYKQVMDERKKLKAS